MERLTVVKREGSGAYVFEHLLVAPGTLVVWRTPRLQALLTHVASDAEWTAVRDRQAGSFGVVVWDPNGQARTPDVDAFASYLVPMRPAVIAAVGPTASMVDDVVDGVAVSLEIELGDEFDVASTVHQGPHPWPDVAQLLTNAADTNSRETFPMFLVALSTEVPDLIKAMAELETAFARPTS